MPTMNSPTRYSFHEDDQPVDALDRVSRGVEPAKSLDPTAIGELLSFASVESVIQVLHETGLDNAEGIKMLIGIMRDPNAAHRNKIAAWDRLQQTARDTLRQAGVIQTREGRVTKTAEDGTKITLTQIQDVVAGAQSATERLLESSQGSSEVLEAPALPPPGDSNDSEHATPCPEGQESEEGTPEAEAQGKGTYFHAPPDKDLGGGGISATRTPKNR